MFKRIAFLLISSTFVLGSSRGADSDPQWKTKMQGLSQSLTTLLADLYSDVRFSDPKNRKTIEKNADQFAALAHGLRDTSGKSADHDPTLKWVAKGLSDDSKYGAKLLRDGNREYARIVLKGVTQYCIACHTRNAEGISFTQTTLASVFEGLKPREKAELYTSLRDYDSALNRYEEVIKGSANDELFEFEKAVRGGIAIAVRVKRDPVRAREFLDLVLKRKGLPFYIKQRLARWEVDLKAWEKEPKKVLAGEALLRRAKKLTAEAMKVQAAPVDRSADVLYLRSTSDLHEYLAKLDGAGVKSAEASYLLGVGYEVMDDLGVRGFNEFYFQNCIVSAPHTPVAQKCYQRYEESVYFGYSGSSGTFVPADLRERLSKFESLAIELPNQSPKKPL